MYIGGGGLAPNSTHDADQANAWFGESVASAGDVNGDGYSDVIIGLIHDGLIAEGGICVPWRAAGLHYPTVRCDQLAYFGKQPAM
ncbi:MAG: FG-GAP repeat protein [Chitinophagaceae bacterium]|nr:FG-GAP repeat protein [Chitinophagaceae bacterium]